MTVRRDDDIIHLVGDCYVEEAETLFTLSQEPGVRLVDVSQCRHLHAAVAQVLLSFELPVGGLPADDFLRDHVLPNLKPADAVGL